MTHPNVSRSAPQHLITPCISATNTTGFWEKLWCEVSAAFAYKSQRSCKLTHHLLTARRQAFIHHTASITPLWPPSVASVAKNGRLISWTATIGQYICNKRPLDSGSPLIRHDSAASESPYFCFIYFTRPSSVVKVDRTTRQALFLFYFGSFYKGIMSVQDKFRVQAGKFVERNAD